MSSLLITLVLVWSNVWYLSTAWHSHFYFPTECKEFQDARSQKELHNNRTVMKVPATHTSTHDRVLTFYLAPSSDDSHATIQETLCAQTGSTNSYFEVKLERSSGTVVPARNALQTGFDTRRYFTDADDDDEDVGGVPFFTVDGVFHSAGQFYNPDEYCVLNVSDSTIVLKACQVDCSANLSTSHLLSPYPKFNSPKVCIPKCCGMDETLSLEDYTCRRLRDTEPLYFFPYLHLPTPIWSYPPEVSVLIKSYTLALPGTTFEKRVNTWNNSSVVVAGGSHSIWHSFHFYRNEKLKNCRTGHENNLKVEKFKYHEVNVPTNRKNKPFRLEMAPTKVRAAYLTRSRKWKQFAGEYCVDGVDHWGFPQTDDGIIQVVLMCNPDDGQFSETGAVVIGSSTQSSEVVAWIYAVTVTCSCLLLLAALSMHLGLREQLTLQGLVVMSHCACIVLSYGVGAIGEFAFVSDFARSAGNVEKHVGQDDGVRTIGGVCFTAAFAGHYFQLASLFWLTVMNSGMFRVMPWPFLKTIMSSRDNARMNKALAFRVISAFAWAVPLVIVLGFVGVDVLYRSAYLEVVVPDYGVETCHAAASWSAGYYVHAPNGILLGLNLLFILYRFGVYFRVGLLVDGSHERKAQLKNQANDEYFYPGLFRAVWGVEFVTCAVMLVAWYSHVAGASQNLDWLIPTLKFLTVIFEPLCLLYIYCLNDHVLEFLVKKYPAMLGTVKVLKACKLVWTGDGLTGGNSLERGVHSGTDDTVVIEAGQESWRMRAAGRVNSDHDRGDYE